MSCHDHRVVQIILIGTCMWGRAGKNQLLLGRGPSVHENPHRASLKLIIIKYMF